MNLPDIIGGRAYSGHALDQMQGRGFTPTIVESVIQNGVQGPGNQPGSLTHYDPYNRVTVVTDEATGRVVTVREGPP
jgi:filamentous hemagglutinin